MSGFSGGRLFNAIIGGGKGFFLSRSSRSLCLTNQVRVLASHRSTSSPVSRNAGSGTITTV
ncbi:MAG: hypothetical protein ACOYLF_13670 [Blastocatellia bacterium]